MDHRLKIFKVRHCLGLFPGFLLRVAVAYLLIIFIPRCFHHYLSRLHSSTALLINHLSHVSIRALSEY